jgi:biotin carboxyl carrier protein
MKNFNFKIAGRDYTTKVEEQENGTLLVTVNGKTYEVNMPEQAHAIHKTIARPAAAATTPAAPSATPAAAKANTMSAPLPGTITKIVAQKGQKVKKGDVLIVMEAMKMANDIVAESDGTVKDICVSVGQSVNQGDALVEFQADATAAPAPKAAPTPQSAPAPAAAAPKAPAGANSVTAPLPGTITKILVQVGQQVKAGETVLVMEAMKMENNITAEFDGTVKAILVQQGAQVQSGDALVEMA